MKDDGESALYKGSVANMRDTVYSYGVRQGMAEMRAEMRQPDSELAPWAQREKRKGWCDALLWDVSDPDRDTI